MALVGDDLATAVPVVLPTEAFQRTNAINCFTEAEITGVNGHGANPPVLRHGPHAGGAPNTHALRARRAMLLPPAAASDIISGSANGTYTLPGFWNTHVNPGLTSPVAAVQADWRPVAEWFRLASTNDNAGNSVIGIAPVHSPSPLVAQRLNTSPTACFWSFSFSTVAISGYGYSLFHSKAVIGKESTPKAICGVRGRHLRPCLLCLIIFNRNL